MPGEKYTNPHVEIGGIKCLDKQQPMGEYIDVRPGYSSFHMIPLKQTFLEDEPELIA